MKTFNINTKITGEKIYLEMLKNEHASSLFHLKLKNRNYFQPFQPKQPDVYFTYEMQLDMIKRALKFFREDESCLFGIFRTEDKELVGYISLGGVMRGAFQSGMLTFAVDEENNKRGYMGEALGLFSEYLFDELKLHRVQCAVIPNNTSAVKVLERNGYQREGYFKKYLKINNEWEDHIIYSKINNDFES